jgi:hypothetical protein
MKRLRYTGDHERAFGDLGAVPGCEHEEADDERAAALIRSGWWEEVKKGTGKSAAKKAAGDAADRED